ncbi:MAG: N-6 DNA methylase [Chitinophagales bacterium]|nr:N-6 DNA methylase [Chitinophagales bacterium]
MHEESIRIDGFRKAPDYSFRLSGGKNLFFVEAKKPSVLIKDEITPAYQVRRYGWSAKLPVSIITDFEEFAVYDCAIKPLLSDKASNARIKYLTYENYLPEFDFIWNTFSKEKVLKGSFDKFVQGDKNKRGTTTVDHEFLQSLDNWRTFLALSIAANNPKLNEDELNFVVQQTIDRIIFLRIAEDRNVEQYGNLQDVIKHGDYYQNLLRQFHIADQKYNSGLFDFKKDKISDTISIDDKTIRKIINDLYYPASPYEFSVLSVEILGSAYEQFLGKTITLAKAGKASIQEKPEVRKAGGVYYTPQYIVEYIVKNTVGKLIENKTPKQINKIRIVDPACGSGSFLIGAYQALLNYHKDYYNKYGKPSKGGKENPLRPDGDLTTAEKKRILINNIYGVDIDANAVEVTKLSLLLKCMEGETDASIATQMKLFHDRVLPTLDNNIKNGNSLIDVDFYSAELDFGEEKKIKPFSWEKKFPEVFKQGGFNCVIGNPPYLKLTINNTNINILNYYKKNFASYSGGSSKNLFQLFLERVIHLKPQIFSFIVPEALLTTESNGEIREILTKEYGVNALVIFDHFVFQQATIGTTIFVAERSGKRKTKVIKMNSLGNYSLLQELKLIVSKKPWNISLDNETKELFLKISSKAILMKDLVNMSKGMVVKNRKEILEGNRTQKNLPFLLGNCMNRYQLHYDKYANYDKLEIIGGTRDFSKQTATPRLLIRRTGSILCATYSDQKELIESTLYILTSNRINLKFLLGVINSRLLTYYLSKKLVTNTQGFPQVLMGQLEQLPVTKADKRHETEIIKLVDQLLQLNEEKQKTKLQSKIDQLQSRIDYCEQRINEIVYRLYGLTKSEIRIVEGA